MSFSHAENPSITLEIALGQTSYSYAPLFEEFAAKHKITIQTSPPENYDLKAALISNSKNKRLPDAFLAPVDYTSLPNLRLQTISEDWLVSESCPKAKALAKSESGYQAIPISKGNHLLLFYNKDLVETPAQTWEQLVSQQLTLPNDVSLIGWAFNGMYNFIPFLNAFDASPIVNGRPNLNTPGMSSALEFVWQQVSDNIVIPACDWSCFGPGFSEGKYAYVIDGPWSLRHYRQALKSSLGATTIPMINGKTPAPYFSAIAMAIPEVENTPENKIRLDKLKQLALFLQSEDVQLRLWLTDNALPVNLKTLKTITQSADQATMGVIEALDSATPLANTPYMNIIWEVLSKGHQRYGSGLMTAPQAGEFMQHIAERSIAN